MGVYFADTGKAAAAQRKDAVESLGSRNETGMHVNRTETALREYRSDPRQMHATTTDKSINIAAQVETHETAQAPVLKLRHGV